MEENRKDMAQELSDEALEQASGGISKKWKDQTDYVKNKAINNALDRYDCSINCPGKVSAEDYTVQKTGNQYYIVGTFSCDKCGRTWQGQRLVWTESV